MTDRLVHSTEVTSTNDLPSTDNGNFTVTDTTPTASADVVQATNEPAAELAAQLNLQPVPISDNDE